MSDFQYKLEFSYDSSASADASVFIQMRDNPPIYQDRIEKEVYDLLAQSSKSDFLTALFNIAGVVELSSKAYRIWLMKSPVYSWQEVLVPTLAYLSYYFQHDRLSPLPGSGNTDGTGLTLDSQSNRRKI